MAQDSDRRFRNEPERVETEAHDEHGIDRGPEPAWMPETNSGRAAMATSVRAMRSAEGAGKVSSGARAPVAQAMSASPGNSLDSRTQTAGAQAGFGDLSGVQVHTDAAAADAASSIGAKAFAVGNDIFFGAGYFQPGSEKGDQLLGHELAHTAQQRGAATQVQTKLEVSTPGESMEVEADQAGSVFAQAARGHAVSPVSLQSTGQTIARDVESTGDAQMDQMAAEMERRNNPLTERQVRSAIAFNRGRHLPAATWQQIGRVVGIAAPSGEIDAPLVQAIGKFQKGVGLGCDGQVGDFTMQWLSQQAGGEGLSQHVQSNDTVYFGMNPDSRSGELGVLKGAASGNVTGAIGERQQATAMVNGVRVNLGEEAGLDQYLAQFSLLGPTQLGELKNLFNGLQGSSKDEVAQLAKILYEAQTGKRLIKRMVLSGHSGGTSLYGGEGEGRNSMDISDLEKFSTIFPMALGQVEDLMLSACNTGWTRYLDSYKKIFPNVRSVWGYVGYSPAYGGGSERHIKEWEKTSRGNIDQRRMDAGRERIAGGSGKNDKNVALWTREGGFAGQAEKTTYNTDSPEVASSWRGVDTLRSVVDSKIASVFDPAFGQGTINQSELNELYTQLQALLGQFSSELGDRLAYYQRHLKQTLYLRHWTNIAKNFMDTHGDKVNAGYRAASASAPNFRGLTRSEALRKIAEYPGDKSGEGYKLLVQYLRDLDPAVIPDEWN